VMLTVSPRDKTVRYSPTRGLQNINGCGGELRVADLWKRANLHWKCAGFGGKGVF